MRDAKTGDVLTRLAFHGILHRVFRPACCSQHLVALAVLGRFGLEDLGDRSSAHDATLRDWRNVKTFGIDVFVNPGTLGRLIGYVERPDEDLVVVQGGQRGHFEGESLIGTREFGKIGRLVG